MDRGEALRRQAWKRPVVFRSSILWRRVLFFRAVARSPFNCAHRRSTVCVCAFCEHEGRLGCQLTSRPSPEQFALRQPDPLSCDDDIPDDPALRPERRQWLPVQLPADAPRIADCQRELLLPFPRQPLAGSQ